MIILGICGLVLLALLGAPLYLVFAGLALLGFHSLDVDLAAVIVELYRMSSMPSLMAIPLFTFSGYLMAESQAPARVVRMSRALFGWLPGGLAVMCLGSCAVFTAFTGASGVTIVALGGLLLPMLLQEKYEEKFTLGLVTTSGSQGLLFPPSLAVILYGLVSGASVDQLFIAGVLPGVFALSVLALYCISVGRKVSNHVDFNKRELWQAFKGLKWEWPLPVLVIGGIYGGIFTAAEASVITAVYVIMVECLILRDVHWFKDLPRLMHDSMITVGGIIIILGTALGFTSYLIDQQIPMKILDATNAFITSKWAFLVILNIFLLMVGCMMDIFSAIFVVAPLLIPIAESFGVHPLHLGIIFLTNLEIGYSTPPLGINLFLASYRFGKPTSTIYRSVLPFLLLRLPILLVVTYWPWLTMALVGGGP